MPGKKFSKDDKHSSLIALIVTDNEWLFYKIAILTLKEIERSQFSNKNQFEN